MVSGLKNIVSSGESGRGKRPYFTPVLVGVGSMSGLTRGGFNGPYCDATKFQLYPNQDSVIQMNCGVFG